MQSAVSAPLGASIAPGVASSCYNWEVVQPGFDCHKLVQDKGITLDQLHLWNPDIDEDCDNLRVGYA